MPNKPTRSLTHLKVSLLVVAGILILAMMLGQIVYQQQTLLDNHRWVVHTQKVQETGIRLIKFVLEGAASVRGYLLTGDTEQLDIFYRLAIELPPMFEQLKQLIADNPNQQRHLDTLGPLLQKRLQLNVAMVETYASLPAADKVRMIKDAQMLNRSIDETIGLIWNEERLVLLVREEQMQRTARQSLAWSIAITSVLAAIAAGLAWSLYRQSRGRQVLLGELAMLNGELENRNANLQAANLAISGANRSKTEFLSAMSHELRTPLNSIIGFTGVLRMGIAGPLNEEQHKQLDMVYGSSQHLLHLINDLLDISRIESGRSELLAEAFDVREVVNETLRVVLPLAEKKHLRLVSTCDTTPMPVYSDRRKVYQILLNLVNNAVKFSGQGSITVGCEAADGYWCLSVQDHGIGIKQEHLASLFEAFHQVDGSARRVYEGTGLGLYLSKKLADMLGGDISVSSEYGKGSRFCFRLPQNPIEEKTS
ncbi:MAG: CHASE3 domain-containing protein [Methylomonas sp.]|nr:CHASE3 domain-containing protein [Methylomonas sp.]